MKAVILAAGVGSRLGKPFPKSLSQLPNGEMILGRQIRILREHGIKEIYVVVGFKKEFIMEYFPNVFFCYNPVFYITNTSKSLLHALEDLEDDVIWLNGDVIFDERIIERIVNWEGSVVAVNSAQCGEEEVKYRAGKDGFLQEISKTVIEPQGEAVGINKIACGDIVPFKEALRKCADHDYFERGIELLIGQGGKIKTMDISDCRCIEVDFLADWEAAVSLFKE